jgi:hypothetical protein
MVDQVQLITAPIDQAVAVAVKVRLAVTDRLAHQQLVVKAEMAHRLIHLGDLQHRQVKTLAALIGTQVAVAVQVQHQAQKVMVADQLELTLVEVQTV